MRRMVLFCGVSLAAQVCGGGALGAEKHEVVRDVVYARRGTTELAADLYVPRGEGPHPGVLVVHGGAWMSGRRTQLAGYARKLADRGFTAVAISYRLAPRHPFPAQIEDCRDAVRWMCDEAPRHKIDPERIGALGYSAGGHLVTLLAVEPNGQEGDADDGKKAVPRIKAVVAGGAPCDFRPIPEGHDGLAYWLGGTRAERPEAYRDASPASFASADDPPVFFFHGEKDRLVPLASPRWMSKLLGQAGVDAHVHTVKGAGHIGAVFNAEATDAALDFLDRQLKPQVAAEAPEASESSEPEGRP